MQRRGIQTARRFVWRPAEDLGIKGQAASAGFVPMDPACFLVAIACRTTEKSSLAAVSDALPSRVAQ